MNLIINLDNDEWILDDMDKTMADYGACEFTSGICCGWFAIRYRTNYNIGQ
jgi:hypothetical protein